MAASYDIVIPTIGRPALRRMLRSLADSSGPAPGRVVVVDDSPGGNLPAGWRGDLRGLAGRASVVRSGGRGPAAARNAGWRAASAEWVAFLDDDVVLPSRWREELVSDLGRMPERVAGVQGRLLVPLPTGRRPTDRERAVAGLERARWATADMAYRRRALNELGGFDERFPRAYREDADLALRALDAGWTLAEGDRSILHPVLSAPWRISVAQQAGNADDALMRRLHGRRWRVRAEAPLGRFPAHVATVTAATGALIAASTGRRRLAWVAAGAWAFSTAAFAWERIRPGPGTTREVAAMAATSFAIPFAAVSHRLRGEVRARATAPAPARRPRVVLLDRDGTLVVDVPYNGDPDLVELTPTARAAIARLDAAGVPSAVVTNQRGVADGLIDVGQVHMVNRRIDELLGSPRSWFVCVHAPDDGCACRKPAPGLVERAAKTLGVEPFECVVIGDTGADVRSAAFAGARAILVPTEATRPEEVAEAPEVASSLVEAVERALGAPS